MVKVRDNQGSIKVAMIQNDHGSIMREEGKIALAYHS